MKNKTRQLTLSAFLIALGIIIPMSPFKIVMPGASYTLASHVPVFIAMFISPGMAVAVALGTALGFLLSGMDIVIVMRALSHVIFAFVGALYLQKHRDILRSTKKTFIFAVVIGFIHVFFEAISVFILLPTLPISYVLLTIGLGGFVHSMVDFYLALLIYKALERNYIS